jgi:8-oxo-dGTP pyrophosphatase MutT (NUDIX family)
MTIVRSYGVACFRSHNNSTQVLLIRRRLSFEFCTFVCGNYTLRTLPQLLDKMTLDEKLCIISWDFKYIWYTYSLNNRYTREYIQKKSKFDNLIIKHQSEIKRMIRESKNMSSDALWELPKGRKMNKRETDIQCAVREFGEESAIPKSYYTLSPTKYSTYSYNDDETYVIKYYIATTNQYIASSILIDDLKQVQELREVRWVELDDVRMLSRNPDASQSNMHKFLKPLFKIAKKIIKGK